MILHFFFFFSIIIFNLSTFIHANEQFHFGILNHHTQWYFYCPRNISKILNPPSNDQPLISYECPYPSSPIEILPIEIDLTFLCRSESRLIWVIIDLYQYNTHFWLLDSNNLEMKVELNNQISIIDSKIEQKNYTNHLIIINAFYIPFESIEILSNQQIHIHIQIRNLHQLNRCHFLLKANLLWETFLNQNCHSDQPQSFLIEHAQCDFYSNQIHSIDQIEVSDNYSIITSTLSHPHMIIPINDNQSISEHNEIHHSISFEHHYFLLEEHYRQILLSLARSTRNPILLKLTFTILLIILLLLILFFLYMLWYHYSTRSKIQNSLVSI